MMKGRNLIDELRKNNPNKPIIREIGHLSEEFTHSNYFHKKKNTNIPMYIDCLQ